MKKILVISTSYEEQVMIEEVARHQDPGGYVIETTASFGQDAVWWAENAPDALVLSLPQDDLLQSYFFTKLRQDVPKNQAIIIISESISAALMRLSTEFGRVRILKSPLQKYDIYRAILQLTQRQVDGGRIHPRYLTEISADIISPLKTGRIIGVIRNLSLSGAYVESDDYGFDPLSGDVIRISITSQEQAKDYNFDAKIIWKKTLTDNRTLGMGITFVNKQEVYNQLIKHL